MLYGQWGLHCGLSTVLTCDAPTLGGFLYLTVASLAAGMTVSALRWAIIDSLHARTGLSPPTLDFYWLGPNVEALSLLIEIHYRHYQFYSNRFVATAIPTSATDSTSATRYPSRRRMSE